MSGVGASAGPRPGPVVALFFAALAALGLLLHGDYGISWDEPLVAAYGNALWDFLAGGARGELVGRARYHGTVVPLLWALLERIDALADPRDLYRARHLLNYAFFALGVAGFHRLCRRAFGSWRLALLGALFLVASPRHFGHAFYNPKDIPFLAAFVWAVYAGVRFVDAPGWRTALACAGASALAANFRLLGLLAPLLALAGLAAHRLALGARGSDRRLAALAALVAGTTAVGFVALFPSLWARPLTGLAEAFAYLAHYPHDLEVLYRGELLRADALPWHYPFVWMGITIPVAWLALSGVGLAAFLGGLRPRRTWLAAHWLDLMVLAWLALPLAAVTALGSVLYDDWRHLYFVYPALLYFALAGARRLLARPAQAPLGPVRGAVAAALALALLESAFQIAIHHPHEGVYFNRLAGGPSRIAGRFDLDYWGTSYRRGLEWIAARDPRPHVAVRVADPPGERNLLILDRRDRERIEIAAGAEEADYLVTSYRTLRVAPEAPPLHAVEVKGLRILGVYDLRAPAPSARPSGAAGRPPG